MAGCEFGGPVSSVGLLVDGVRTQVVLELALACWSVVLVPDTVAGSVVSQSRC